jgi:hypothetical protein
MLGHFVNLTFGHSPKIKLNLLDLTFSIRVPLPSFYLS